MPLRVDVNLGAGEVVADTYEIVRQIAKGGMGVVYEARHVRLEGRRVAVKVLAIDPDHNDEFLARFRREAEIGAALNHPNIITVTDWNILPDGSPFFVMEYLVGEDLSKRMKRGKISMAEALHYVASIGAALQAAHNKGVVHRDLKPSNVYLCETDEDALPLVKVLDFGISKIVVDDTLSTKRPKLLGTPRYMSPEQARGDRVGVQADQFSMGVIAYELFAGRPAFTGDTLESIVYKVVHEPPKPLEEMNPELPENMVAAVNRALAKDPAQRFLDVRGFVEAVLGDRESTLTTDIISHPELFIGESSSGQDTTMNQTRETRTTRGAYVVLVLAITALAVGFMVKYLSPPFGNGVDEITVTQAPTSTPTAASTENAVPTTATPAIGAATPTTTATTSATVAIKELPSVKEKLDRVEALYAAKEFPEALRLALQSIGVQETPRAHLLVALCHCAMHDLGNANASYHLVTDEKDRAKVRAECAKRGIEF